MNYHVMYDTGGGRQPITGDDGCVLAFNSTDDAEYAAAECLASLAQPVKDEVNTASKVDNAVLFIVADDGVREWRMAGSDGAWHEHVNYRRVQELHDAGVGQDTQAGTSDDNTGADDVQSADASKRPSAVDVTQRKRSDTALADDNGKSGKAGVRDGGKDTGK